MREKSRLFVVKMTALCHKAVDEVGRKNDKQPDQGWE